MQCKIDDFAMQNKDNEQKVREKISEKRLAHRARNKSQTEFPHPQLHSTPQNSKENQTTGTMRESVQGDDTPEITAHEGVYTQPPLFDDPTDPRDNDQKRKLTETEEEEDENTGDEKKWNHERNVKRFPPKN